ncbi:hypothetical protein P170DRAFT_427951 [Aspergillus steynii IBT 23096]|uniref:Uncharacterized protein n=1 Tax=Aspergillus steynii IBT 23096 TaxID=1392250 RepID=A0A2I2G195_9EURO|nr:uncharacterized protein P170DRAFT_427951 [Aspergillus steynii IBT 23096]PLB46651.1 hypothetical protein P170DRAFT_427951 [Aspergillus steynii IBT 23096]
MPPLRRYIHQERLLYSIDRFLHGIFDRRSPRGWSADLIDFIPPSGIESQGPLWQLISDNCFAISRLVRSNKKDMAEATLQETLNRLTEICRHGDPYFMVKFWRVCLFLRVIDRHCPELEGLSKLLSTLEQGFLEHQQKSREDHPLLVTVQALRNTHEDDFKDTLRIGYFKAIRTMADLNPYSDKNGVTLHMICVYFKYFDKQFVDKIGVLQKLHETWSMVTDQDSHISSLAVISASYYWCYAARYIKKCFACAYEAASRLLEDSKVLIVGTSQLSWTFPALVFTFASTVVANQALKNDDFGTYYATLDYAILALEGSDRECCTQASLLSKSLKNHIEKLLKIRPYQEIAGWERSTAKVEQERLERIESRIDQTYGGCA